MDKISLETLRKNIIGNNILITTPFGKRHLFYADYTASGRGVQLIEERMQQLLPRYANTHTEDSATGLHTTTLLHQAEREIKRLVNAGKHGKLIPIGSGSTGGLKRLHEILGIYLPARTRERIAPLPETDNKPVVLIGPYEHHTNELMWREAYVDIVVLPFDQHDHIDLKALEKTLQHPRYQNREKIVSLSAGSNVTGLKTAVYEVAKIAHRNGAIIIFDFAAVAPYITIDMNRDGESYFDAIVFSPHKFPGGPGTCGVAIFNEKIYRTDLPPTTAGGGTVDYVGCRTHHFLDDIEERELAGTPPILQTIKTALVMQLKEAIGVDRIEAIEQQYCHHFFHEIKKIDQIELLGEIPPNERLPIFSFNIKDRDKILHPRFVTRLLNDLFGIQSRGGCSCAGPYGHHLLKITPETSFAYKEVIGSGLSGLKPGWIRVNLHYTFTQNDVDYLIKSLQFIAQYGNRFLNLYNFNIKTGKWLHHKEIPETITLSLNSSIDHQTVDLATLEAERESYFDEAIKIAEQLPEPELPEERDHSLYYFYT